MALEDFNPGQVEIVVKRSEYSNEMILLCEFVKDDAGDNTTHCKVGVRGSFFTEEDLAKALDLFSNQDKDASYFDARDRLTFQRFHWSLPSILVANILGKSITKGEAEAARDLLLRKELIIKNAFQRLDVESSL